MGKGHKGVSDIPVVILCGGQGTRFREETQFYPKPLVEVGDHPIVWHVMDIYSRYGFNNFILCLGYKGMMIKKYFIDYQVMHRDIELTFPRGKPKFIDEQPGMEGNISLVDTGAETMTGSRVKRVEKYVDTENFMVTYADGVADIDIQALLDFHRSHGKIGTVTGVQVNSQFGELVTENGHVKKFSEKPELGSVINGGFFVFRKEFFDYLDADESCILEKDPLERLAADGQLLEYRHNGFWQCLDTYKDNSYLNNLWATGKPPWVRDK